MTLSEWINRENMSASSFAKKYGFPANTLYRYLRGDSAMCLENKLKIVEATGAEVGISDLGKLEKRSTALKSTVGPYLRTHPKWKRIIA